MRWAAGRRTRSASLRGMRRMMRPGRRRGVEGTTGRGDTSKEQAVHKAGTLKPDQGPAELLVG